MRIHRLDASSRKHPPSEAVANTSYHYFIKRGLFLSHFAASAFAKPPRKTVSCSIIINVYQNPLCSMSKMGQDHPDAGVFPSATGPAGKMVKEHQADEPLKLYSGWVFFCVQSPTYSLLSS